MKPDIQHVIFEAPDQIVRHVLCGLPLSQVEPFARPIATNVREAFMASVGNTKIGTETVINLRQIATSHIRQYLMDFDKIPKVLYCLTGNKATDFYRAVQVSRVLNERGKVMVSCVHDFDLATASFFDIIVFILESRPRMVNMVKALKKMGKKLVYDIDDCIEQIPESVVSSRIFNKDRVDAMYEIMSICDAITSPTGETVIYYQSHDGMKDKLGWVLPNVLSTAIMPQAVPKDDGIFRIVFAGSPSHQDDLRMVKDALITVKKTHGKSVEYTFIGLSKSELAAVFGEWDEFKAIEFVEFEKYFDTLAETNADLGIAPLVDRPFSHYKSPIKAVEYVSCGIPCLASNIMPFAILKEPFSTMFATDWECDISKFIEEKKGNAGKMRTVLGMQLVQIEKYDVSKNITRWEEFFRNLKNRGACGGKK